MTGPGQSEIRAVDVPARRDGEVLVRALQSGISRGTEALVFAGRVPEGESVRMRCPFQEGDFPFPVKYGYASVGVIKDGPADRVGQRVFCLYPHQSLFVVPDNAAITVPSNVPTGRAVLAAQIETALNASWDLAPRIGDRIAIVGGGTIGCLVAWLCGQVLGTEVTLIDTNPERAPIAHGLGVRFSQGHGAPRNCDAVFHASGSSEGLSLALSLSGFEAEVMELSWYGDAPVAVPLGGAFHSQRLSLRSSQVGAVSPSRRARWSHARRLALALSLASDPRLDALVQEATSFDDLPESLPGLLRRPGALFHRVIYPQE
jgi:2-desacetyl-2-hydroxyethyl bacteriochlorophyllide A dehydrogenase